MKDFPEKLAIRENLAQRNFPVYAPSNIYDIVYAYFLDILSMVLDI